MMLDPAMPRAEIEQWLRETDAGRLEELWRTADAVRAAHVGDAVHLRGLVEISNHCARGCAYCGLRGPNGKLERYRMTAEDILACADEAVAFGYGTLVMQAGEDYGLTRDFITGVIAAIKARTPLAATLSLGERPLADLAAWRDAGADRYLLRFETSDRSLYEMIHPPLGGQTSDRLAMLADVRDLGYEIGGGVMIGIPGQTYAMLAGDVDAFRKYDFDMLGMGPYIPHPDTPLGSGALAPAVPPGEQVPADELMTYKMIALARIVRPDANIPSTTALATLNKATGRELGLARGANVVMPNLTPPRYRVLYEVYPGKACVSETAEACRGRLEERIRSLGREVGGGPGGRRRGGGKRERLSSGRVTALRTGRRP
ncbi:MAG: [FeFe] hydrogenase H-cluster radical SAM maturase HydE [Planctomycetota bacterium]